MVGVCYFGAVQLAVAATQPPHLKAIMPMNAPADFYREATYHGGILQTFFDCSTRSSRAAGRRDTAEERTPEELGRGRGARGDGSAHVPAASTTRSSTRRAARSASTSLTHPTDGPFYWERSAYRHYDRIKVPCYSASGWWAYAHMHLRGAFQNYLGIDAPQEALHRGAGSR